MAAGPLDLRARFERATPGRDALGGAANDGWQALGTVWAAKSDASDAERFAADQKTAVLTSRFVVRSSELTRSVTPADRLVIRAHRQETAFEILGVKQTKDGRDRFIEITAIARVDAEAGA